MTDDPKKARRAPKTLLQKMVEALDCEEAKLEALTKRVNAAEHLARSLRGQHTNMTNEVNRMCKLVGRKDMSDRLPRYPADG